jgi:putative transposase
MHGISLLIIRDFFKGALQKVEARRRSGGDSGETASTTKLDRTLASRLATDALEPAITARKPLPGLVHHSDRGIQYASGEYVAILRKHEIVPSMSRPANPYDNASCESFIKTLKREKIYANEYLDLDHLRSNVEEFIERYYNQKRLHSALGYRSPEEFEEQAERENSLTTASYCGTSEQELFRIERGR